MEIEHCIFPDDLLYDLDNNTWLRQHSDGDVTVGITSILSAITGKFTSVRFRNAGTIEKGHSLGTIESSRFVGPFPSPVSGTIFAMNPLVVRNPKLLNESPYGQGWVARVKPSNFEAENVLLAKIRTAERVLRGKVLQYRARCFKAFPDHEMVEIGVECSAVLLKLKELLSTIPMGEVVHIVTDDPTSYVEMVRWTEQTGNSLVDWRSEGNLFHFIVRKTG